MVKKLENVLECVYAYETETGEKGIVRADSYNEAVDRVNDSINNIENSPRSLIAYIVKLYELDDMTYGVIPSQTIKKRYHEVKYERKEIYDEMSRLIDEYEDYVNGNGEDGQIYEKAADMYSMLLKVQGVLEKAIVAVE